MWHEVNVRIQAFDSLIFRLGLELLSVFFLLCMVLDKSLFQVAEVLMIVVLFV